MCTNDYTKTAFFKTLMGVCKNYLEKNYLDELSKDYLRAKGNFEYAIRQLCRFLIDTDFNMETHIIFKVPDTYLYHFYKKFMKENDLEDPKAAVLFGKMVESLNRLLLKDMDVMTLWEPRQVVCECGGNCHLLAAHNAYSHSAVALHNLSKRYYYRCPLCGAMVGTHEGTNIPLGIPANKITAQMRKNTHQKIDKIVNNRNIERTDIYNYLSEKLPEWDKEKVHVGNFDISHCIEANKILNSMSNVKLA